jgi:hypothetical protein
MSDWWRAGATATAPVLGGKKGGIMHPTTTDHPENTHQSESHLLHLLMTTTTMTILTMLQNTRHNCFQAQPKQHHQQQQQQQQHQH